MLFRSILHNFKFLSNAAGASLTKCNTCCKISNAPNIIIVDSELTSTKKSHNNNNEIIDDHTSIEMVKEIRKLHNFPVHMKPVVTPLYDFSLKKSDDNKYVELHPEIFSCNPRMDYLCNAVEWQKVYKEVDYTWLPTRADIGVGKAKPWPQKGTGRARHGSTNSPLWYRGAKANPPRGPVPLYYEQSFDERISALTSALTVRQIQNDLMIIKDYKIDEEIESFQEILEKYKLPNESSMLIIHSSNGIDINENAFKILEDERKINVFSVVALNVYSILKHDKLVITLDAVEELETKLTWHLHRYDWIGKPNNFCTGIPFMNEDLQDFEGEIYEEEAAEDLFDYKMDDFEELGTHDIPFGRLVEDYKK